MWIGTAKESKGLEFDTVVLVEPSALGDNDGHGSGQHGSGQHGGGRTGLSLQYVALTRATQRLTVIGTERG